MQAMLRTIKRRVWAFDVEWVPDPVAGRVLYDLPDSVTDPRAILETMWREGGASEENPRPFLKTVSCRIVSIAVVERRLRADGGVALSLLSLPRNPSSPDEARESHIVDTFLRAVGDHHPQLVGYNSLGSDLKILVQRAVVLGLDAPRFCERPDRPWEGVDYFARDGEWSVDLMELLGGRGRALPSLHEVATLSGIPGKLDVEGRQVAELWLDGELERIVAYNQCDALTTYLLWLRVAHFAGRFSTAEYGEEQRRVRELLVTEGKPPGRAHLERYRAEWERLAARVG